MYKIIFYKDKKGCSDVAAYLKELRAKNNKSSRITLNKIVAYLDLLEEMGTRIGEPFTKHLEGKIWELRPMKNRFLYAYYNNNTFIILHHFIKKTKRTPKKELEIAKRRLQEYLERNGEM